MTDHSSKWRFTVKNQFHLQSNNNNNNSNNNIHYIFLLFFPSPFPVSLSIFDYLFLSFFYQWMLLCECLRKIVGMQVGVTLTFSLSFSFWTFLVRMKNKNIFILFSKIFTWSIFFIPHIWIHTISSFVDFANFWLMSSLAFLVFNMHLVIFRNVLVPFIDLWGQKGAPCPFLEWSQENWQAITIESLSCKRNYTYKFIKKKEFIGKAGIDFIRTGALEN